MLWLGTYIRARLQSGTKNRHTQIAGAMDRLFGAACSARSTYPPTRNMRRSICTPCGPDISCFGALTSIDAHGLQCPLFSPVLPMLRRVFKSNGHFGQRAVPNRRRVSPAAQAQAEAQAEATTEAEALPIRRVSWRPSQCDNRRKRLHAVPPECRSGRQRPRSGPWESGPSSEVIGGGIASWMQESCGQHHQDDAVLQTCSHGSSCCRTPVTGTSARRAAETGASGF
ncbi:uncharacterized protein TrAtP1_012502 [Trichoderma atroviride]|uniref:uncharacterized protein n=1 Tax=Hypocrea atroviridis TaxID=63577 RepID=UPI00332EF802|nr:hypothetical protein TrAtP1_012502 [Trichoderma atroviride]